MARNKKSNSKPNQGRRPQSNNNGRGNHETERKETQGSSNTTGNGETSTSDSGTKGAEQQSSADKREDGSNSSSSQKRKLAQTNDPAWYAYSPEMLVTVANIPFSDPLGIPMASGFQRTQHMISNNFNVGDQFQNYAAPGICMLKLKHTVGYSDSMSSPATVAANALYTHVRVVNSGRKNYDPCDLMMYALQIADMYSLIQWLERIYSTAFLYSQRNLYLGRDILQLEGFDVNSIIMNLANFATFINTIISRVAVYAIPSSINFFKRRVFTYSSIYLENPDGNIKDALYAFTPEGFYTFALDSNNVGMLKFEPVPRGGNPITFTSLCNYVLQIVNAIAGDEDFALMSGDIIKAYGTDLLGLASMQSDMALPFGYDPDVLYQMKNADIFPPVTSSTYTRADGTSQGTYGNVYQAPAGFLECREAVDTNVNMNVQSAHNQVNLMRNRMIDSDLAMPSPLNVMESTRLQVCMHKYIRGSDITEIETGVDFVTGMLIRYNYDNAFNASYVRTQQEFTSNVFHWFVKDSLPLLEVSNMLRDVNLRCGFRYAPFLIEAIVKDNVSPGNVDLNGLRVVGNVENYCWYDNDQLQRMHEVALLSLFWVPGIARLVNFGSNS